MADSGVNALQSNVAAARRAGNGWGMYDWANSAFATTSIAAVLPVFFRPAVSASSWHSPRPGT